MLGFTLRYISTEAVWNIQFTEPAFWGVILCLLSVFTRVPKFASKILFIYIFKGNKLKLRIAMVNAKWGCVLFMSLVSVVVSEEIYTDKYDDVNLDDILNNQRLYRSYFQCLVNNGKCTPDAIELKKVLPDAIETECAKCSQKQKKGTERVLRFLITQKPDDFSKLEEIYDPTGTYRKRYAAQKKLAQEGKPVPY